MSKKTSRHERNVLREEHVVINNGTDINNKWCLSSEATILLRRPNQSILGTWRRLSVKNTVLLDLRVVRAMKMNTNCICQSTDQSTRKIRAEYEITLSDINQR